MSNTRLRRRRSPAAPGSSFRWCRSYTRYNTLDSKGKSSCKLDWRLQSRSEQAFLRTPACPALDTSTRRTRSSRPSLVRARKSRTSSEACTSCSRKSWQSQTETASSLLRRGQTCTCPRRDKCRYLRNSCIVPFCNTSDRLPEWPAHNTHLICMMKYS